MSNSPKTVAATRVVHFENLKITSLKRWSKSSTKESAWGKAEGVLVFERFFGLRQKKGDFDGLDLGVEPKIGVITPKSSILIGFSIINHPFGVPLFLETPIYMTHVQRSGCCSPMAFSDPLSFAVTKNFAVAVLCCQRGVHVAWVVTTHLSTKLVKWNIP